MNGKNEVVAGVFVLLGVLLIVSGALWLSGDRWRAGQSVVHARFPTVGQLREGNPVSVRGVRVGEVEEIRFAEDGRVRVTMRLRAGVPLPPEPVAMLRASSLFGDWEVVIAPGSTRPPTPADSLPLGPDEIRGITTADFAELADYTAEIAGNLRGITDRLEIAFNEETAENLARSFANFEEASQRLVDLLGQQREGFGAFAGELSSASTSVKDAAASLDATLSRLEAATEEGELEEIFERARSASVSVDSMSGEWLTAAREIRATVARVDATIDTTRSLLARVNRGEGSLGLLAADTALYENTAAALGELRALLDDLRRNPRKYFNFSIF